jgi:protein-S-isoprenylcysteine O-methyltransferase Ste14
MSAPHDASSRFIWPPVIYGSATIIAGLLSWHLAWPFEPAGLRTALLGCGIALGGLGGVIALLAELHFKAAGTAVLPTRPTTAIVSHGVYGFTRNPMYLGMSLGLAGLALALNQLWFLLVLPVAMFAVTKLAIEREEAYLEAKFGNAYLAYKSRVRCWI